MGRIGNPILFCIFAAGTAGGGPTVPSEGASGHWSFQSIVRPAVPRVSSADWVRNPIDAFILRRLEEEKVEPSPVADRATLVRRLSLDLTGLPPAPDLARDFVNDPRPSAYARLVDRMLESPHFGEQWGRHWLDLARYADSDGYEKDSVRPWAWRYRDWVIQAINDDMPFERFTREQLAGDLLENATVEQKIATGLHRNTLTNKEGGVDQEEFRCQAVVDRVNTTATIWLGLTVGCAECHDHKYDPISQKEFYRLFAFFNSADEKDIAAPLDGELAAYRLAHERWRARHTQLEADRVRYAAEELPERIAEILDCPAERRTEDDRNALADHDRARGEGLKEWKETLEAHRKKEPPFPGTKAPTLVSADEPRATFVHVRGDFLRRGEQVRPGTPSVLHGGEGFSDGANRLDLAEWLVDSGNPLTARVTVNRIWQHLFGRGLVATPEDFGTRGEPPSHPELLDWLADEFARRGWSRKEMIRLIVTSNTYRQRSHHRPELRTRDPRNLWLSRQNRFRMSAENVRDAALSVSGLLSPQIGGPSVRPPLPADIAALGYANSVKWQESAGADKFRRGLYILFQRTVPYPMLATFDAPDSNTACTRRERSNTPLQALALLNDPVFFECAQQLGRKVWEESGSAAVEERLDRLVDRCLSRAPSARERSRLRELHDWHLAWAAAHPEEAKELAGVSESAPEHAGEIAALVAAGRVVMNLDEFITRE
jgi:hypothetical protein